MRDKPIRDMEQSSDSRGPHRQDVSPRSARGGSVAGHEGNLIDFSSETDEKVMEPFQEDLECSSPENAPKSKEKSFVSISARCYNRKVRLLTR